eukprot:gene8738-biopygen113
MRENDGKFALSNEGKKDSVCSRWRTGNRTAGGGSPRLRPSAEPCSRQPAASPPSQAGSTRWTRPPGSSGGGSGPAAPPTARFLGAWRAVWESLEKFGSFGAPLPSPRRQALGWRRLSAENTPEFMYQQDLPPPLEAAVAIKVVSLLRWERTFQKCDSEQSMGVWPLRQPFRRPLR